MSIDRVVVLAGGLVAIAWINWYFFLSRRTEASATATASGVQEIRVTVAGGYSPRVIRVKTGRPVRLMLERTENNPCSEEIVIPDFGIRRFLPANAVTAVEFTPSVGGTHEITCGMGMLHGQVVVE